MIDLLGDIILDADIQAIIEQWPKWGLGFTAQPQLLAELQGGLTNRSFLLQCDQAQWVLRCNAVNSVELGIDRYAERQILTQTAAVGLSATPCFVSAGLDYLVTPFLAAWQPDYPVRPLSRHNIKLMSSRVLQLHQLDVVTSSIPCLDYLLHSDHYLQHIVEHCGALPSEISTLQATEQTSVESFQHSISQPKLCHNDLSPAHWRQCGDELCLIDWEYASLGDPAFELAVLVDTWQLNEQQLEWLLQGYGSVDRERFQLAQRVNSYISTLWSALQKYR